ncbi:ATP-dependent DNA helicase [Aureimonas ureilytica]|uniref:ATP-dependent DNA helicase n=1 Tax=Aureimonas ureilytica TaxID=401562 RepID=UPI0003754519|nr:ATP-dependent RecD-like DNA helicase [Aureimonas ureilytica]
MSSSPMAAWRTELPRGYHVVRFLAGRPEFVGVGPATAQRMWDVFGESLDDILAEGDVERLTKVLPRTQAEIVCDAWRNQRTITKAVAFFDRHGIDIRYARKAVELWGDEAIAKLQENPYRLLTLCTWREVDRAARRLGVGADDPRRQVGAVEAALYERLDGKHTVTSREKLVRHACTLLGATPADAERAVAIAVDDGAAVPCPGGYQPAGAAYAERFIETRIRAALADDGQPRDLLASRPTPVAMSTFLERYNSLASQRLTSEQADAVTMALNHRFAILVGGAGVGKTTTLRAINEAAEHFGFHVHQLALAGRAAQRVADATGRAARTIASWLWDASKGRAETGAHTLVVVDEASMLDLPTLYRILFHLHQDARLLLVGDVAQLAPIGYGLTLHRLVSSPRIPRVELTRIMRADEATGIPAVSRAVREGKLPELPTYGDGRTGCSVVGCGPESVIDEIERIRDDLRGEEVQVVGATYAGPAGIDAINTHFHRYNAHGRLRLKRFAEGDPVIWTKNDHERGLWNGTMGHVLVVKEDRLTVRLDGRTFDLLAADLSGRIDLAYAISTHKAQGSQWGTIIVPLSSSRLFDRALLYTALTRAERRVVLVGDLGHLHRVVTQQPSSLARDVALAV